MPRPANALCTRTTRRRLRAAVPMAATLAGLCAHAALAQQPETPAAIVAAQIRTQGYACADPVSATRDVQASRPNETVWILSCRNATYRVLLVPDMGAQVTQLK